LTLFYFFIIFFIYRDIAGAKQSNMKETIFMINSHIYSRGHVLKAKGYYYNISSIEGANCTSSYEELQRLYQGGNDREYVKVN